MPIGRLVCARDTLTPLHGVRTDRVTDGSCSFSYLDNHWAQWGSMPIIQLLFCAARCGSNFPHLPYLPFYITALISGVVGWLS